MVNTRGRGRGRGKGAANSMDQMAASLQALTARIDQQQNMIMQQQQTIQQLYELLAKREQEGDERTNQQRGSSARIEEEQESQAEPTPQFPPPRMPLPPPPAPIPQEQPQEPPPPPNQPQLTNTQAFTQFRKCNPPKFDGKFDVEKAEAWLMEVEKIFEVLEVTSQQKAILATFMLTKEAHHWWLSIKSVLRAKNLPVTWEIFLEEFYEKYFPRSIRDEKEMEFINLKQEDGDMSVDKYVAKFIELSRYCSYLKKFDDEIWKTEKLERGLKPEIRYRVAVHEIRVFNKLIEVARVTENNLKRMMGPTPKPTAELKRLREEESSVRSYKSGKNTWPRRGNFKERKKVLITQISFSSSICKQCGKNHGSRPCLVGQGVCYRCGKPGHLAKDCPQQKEGLPLLDHRLRGEILP